MKTGMPVIRPAGTGHAGGSGRIFALTGMPPRAY